MAEPQKQTEAELAAARRLEQEKADRERMEREKIMTTATPEAEAARLAMAKKESEAERMKAGAAMTGAAVAAGAAASRTSPEVGERTTRQGAAIGTEPTPVVTRPVTGTVVPPGTETVTPMRPYGTVDERSRMHAEDPSVHPDWERQPQINAPRDVGVPTPEGQADAARIREGRRRSDEAKEPRLERRGEEVTVPPASSARPGGVTGAVKETARDVKETTKEKTREVKEDVDRKI